MVDSSYAHIDRRLHYGISIHMRSNSLRFCTSMALLSKEAEIGEWEILKLQKLLCGQGNYSMTLYEDNKSAIQIA